MQLLFWRKNWNWYLSRAWFCECSREGVAKVSFCFCPVDNQELNIKYEESEKTKLIFKKSFDQQRWHQFLPMSLSGILLLAPTHGAFTMHHTDYELRAGKILSHLSYTYPCEAHITIPILEVRILSLKKVEQLLRDIPWVSGKLGLPASQSKLLIISMLYTVIMVIQSYPPPRSH